MWVPSHENFRVLCEKYIKYRPAANVASIIILAAFRIAALLLASAVILIFFGLFTVISGIQMDKPLAASLELTPILIVTYAVMISFIIGLLSGIRAFGRALPILCLWLYLSAGLTSFLGTPGGLPPAMVCVAFFMVTSVAAVSQDFRQRLKAILDNPRTLLGKYGASFHEPNLGEINKMLSKHIKSKPLSGTLSVVMLVALRIGIMIAISLAVMFAFSLVSAFTGKGFESNSDYIDNPFMIIYLGAFMGFCAGLIWGIRVFVYAWLFMSGLFASLNLFAPLVSQANTFGELLQFIIVVSLWPFSLFTVWMGSCVYFGNLKGIRGASSLVEATGSYLPFLDRAIGFIIWLPLKISSNLTKKKPEEILIGMKGNIIKSVCMGFYMSSMAWLAFVLVAFFEMLGR